MKTLAFVLALAFAAPIVAQAAPAVSPGFAASVAAQPSVSGTR